MPARRWLLLLCYAARDEGMVAADGTARVWRAEVRKEAEYLTTASHGEPLLGGKGSNIWWWWWWRRRDTDTDKHEVAQCYHPQRVPSSRFWIVWRRWSRRRRSARMLERRRRRDDAGAKGGMADSPLSQTARLSLDGTPLMLVSDLRVGVFVCSAYGYRTTLARRDSRYQFILRQISTNAAECASGGGPPLSLPARPKRTRSSSSVAITPGGAATALAPTHAPHPLPPPAIEGRLQGRALAAATRCSNPCMRSRVARRSASPLKRDQFVLKTADGRLAR